MADWDTTPSNGNWDASKWDTGNAGNSNAFEPAPLSDRDPNADHSGFDQATGGEGGDQSCRNCGGDGHFARECPEPKKLTGECFNCGEVGHNKAECTNPRVERPFTGTCRICEQEGHPARECPQREPITCKNCLQEGHKASDCDQARVLDYSKVPTMDVDAAWGLLKTASSEKDIDDFKDAVKIYAKADRQTTYAELEKKFMDAGFKIHLVALEKEMPITMTNVDLQGKVDQKFTVGYYFDIRPVRSKFSEGWPESAEDNLERLKDAGESMDQVLPVCRNCNELGHTSKFCSHEPVENETSSSVACGNCGEAGHRFRDCPKERVDRDACRNCKQSGHRANECPEPRSAENVECKICSQMGHFARDCPQKEESGGGGGTRMCRNCGEEGHFAKECEKPRNPQTITCRNCDEVGHMSKECPKPRDYSRVKCSQCGEMGHTIKRCKQVPNETEYGAGDGFGDQKKNEDAASAAAGGWDSAAPANSSTTQDWNTSTTSNNGW